MVHLLAVRNISSSISVISDGYSSLQLYDLILTLTIFLYLSRILIFCFLVNSWPLAIVGKLIPVPERNFSEYFTRRIRRKKNPSGKYLSFPHLLSGG